MWYCVGIMMKWLDVFRVRDGDNERGRWGGVSYTKEFDRWNRVLKRMNQRKRLPLFSEREIWMVAWGVCSGSELDGKGENFGRPVLVYKKLNRRKFFAIPMSSRTKDLPGWHIYKKHSLVIEESRPLDANRLLKKKEKISVGEFEKVKNVFIDYFK